MSLVGATSGFPICSDYSTYPPSLVDHKVRKEHPVSDGSVRTAGKYISKGERNPIAMVIPLTSDSFFATFGCLVFFPMTV
jgi:hypothetical protein